MGIWNRLNNRSDRALEADVVTPNQPVAPEPREDPPVGASGRAHTHGFLDLEEHNVELRHPHGHRIYDQMYRTDGDVRQAVQIVANPILGGTWSVLPHGGENAASRDQGIAEFVRAAMWQYMSPNLGGHLAQALPVLVRSGMAPFEITWMAVDYTPVDHTDAGGLAGRRIVPRTLGLRLPRTIYQFEQDAYGQLTRIRQQLPVTRASLVSNHGEDSYYGADDPLSESSAYDTPSMVWIEGVNLLYYRLGGEGDNWEGVSMLRPAYKHWLMKDKIERIDAIAQEREGLGIPIAYPPLGATDDQLDAVEKVLDGMRANEQGYIVAPGPKAGAGAPEGQGWLFELIGYDRTGSGRDPQPSLKYHTDKISAAFISEFMRLGHGGGSSSGARATGQTQMEPFLMSIEALVGIIEDALNKLIAQIVAYNFPDVKNPPTLRMSLVDSTSLTQLADYVLKLVQVGALIPDQQLEDFLRARADLPPTDAGALEKRRAQDDKMRREVLTGGGEPGGGATGNQGKHVKPGFAHGDKEPAKKTVNIDGGVGSGGLSADGGGDIILDGLPGGVPISERGNLRPWEHGMMLDALEQRMDCMPDEMKVVAGHAAFGLAKLKAQGKATQTDELSEAIHGVLLDAYHFGGDTVKQEIAGQRSAFTGTPVTVLDRGARDRGPDHLKARADLAAAHVEHHIDQALAGHDLAHGNPGLAQQAAERAGEAALRQAAFKHGVPAIQHGRHDTAVQLAEAGVPIIGARYSAALDKNTCGPCRAADDGRVRALDDPVRLENEPPNPHCDSLASGHNQCRCVEHYELMDESPDTTLDRELVPNKPGVTNWVEQRGGLPGFIGDIAGDLISERGFDTSRAIAVAVNRVEQWAAGGHNVSPATQAKAAEALAQWHAIEGSS